MHEIIKNRIKQLPPEYQTFLASDFFSITTKHFASKFGFDQETTDIFTNGLTLYMTWFIDQKELQAFLERECWLPTETAADTAETIATSLPPDMQELISQGYTLFNGSNTTTTTEKKGTPGQDLTSEIREAEEALQQISSVRTMQSDQQKQTTSNNTLSTPNSKTTASKNKVSGSGTDATKPRWGSDAE